MPLLLTLCLLAALALAAYFLCRGRVQSLSGQTGQRLHSLPSHYGWYGALMVFLPALAVLVLWSLVQPPVIEGRLAARLDPATAADPAARNLALGELRRLAEGLDVAMAAGALTETEAAAMAGGSGDLAAGLAAAGIPQMTEVTPQALGAALEYRHLADTGALGRTLLALLAGVAGFALALRRCAPDFRARIKVERTVLVLLALASTIAILTTLGIVLSMLSESLDFVRQYPVTDFLFGLTWSPNFRGGSELGMVPLIWGTLYITAVSMIVAVPVGLYAAIYLAEYASSRTRAVVKPLIEVIAGIPTVVFGLFALVTVGPFLRDVIARPLGLGDSGSSVMTAGIVIGILNIPFISSLSDDIINAVPQSLRDGSLALGATRSETVRQVVLPAALPGIVGAVLMAASRAIGETMIVTLGAGAAAKLSLNPFEAMTTMTVKIVGQLTGDTDFAAPETLVAFALGLTLFTITLALNVLALMIVRRYREQYE